MKDAWFRLGIESLSQRKPAAALKYFNLGEGAGGDADAFAAQRWYCWMLLGQFENAWRESDAIARRGRQGLDCLWDGLPLSSDRVLIRCLHGLGDAVQFIRYGQLLKMRSARVIVECPSELVSLFRAQPFIDHVVSWADGSSDGFTAWDQQIEVMELPRAFRTVIASAPYLEVPRSHIPSSKGLNVGLVWSASNWNPLRSLPLSALTPILEIEGISFHSFQQGDARNESQDLHRAYNIQEHADACPDILATASILKNMDLVITVDTMAAHLAGALGIPVWTLLNWQADWRWMIDRQDSPWYPTMRLFRQPQPGNWETPVAAMARELRLLADSAIDRDYLGVTQRQMQNGD